MTAYAELSPSGHDDTAAIINALNSLGAYGGELCLNPGLYNVPNGITESKPGLVVRGRGHGVQGPGYGGSNVGVVLQATMAGAWVWRHMRPDARYNDYNGCKISGVSFMGNATTAGGFYAEVGYCTLEDCDAKFHQIGRGFYFLAPAISGGSAQENTVNDCGALNCYIGLETASADGTEIRGFKTLRTSASIPNIHGTGYGIKVFDNNSRIIGGKMEGTATGILVTSVPGISIIGTVFEDNVLDIDLDKQAPTQNWTSNNVCCSAGTVRIGPWNFGDQIFGMRYPRILTDVPNPQGIPKSTVWPIA